MNKDNIEIEKRKDRFLSQINLSNSAKRRYRNALSSTFVNDILHQEWHFNSIYEITDVEILWKFYSLINLHPENVRLHRYYSAPIMQYIKYLNGGKKYGRRIDYMRKRKKDG